MKIDQTRLEREIQVLGKEVFQGMRSGLASLLTAQFYTEKLLAWGMQDEALKVSLFRFVDVLPSLPNAGATIRHVQEYFEPLRGQLPGLLQRGLDVGTSSFTAKLVAPVIRKQISFIAERFIVGESPEKALRTLRGIRKDGMAYTVDLLGEATVSEDESVVYKERYLELLRVLSAAVPSWRESAPLIQGHRGEQTPINISVKLSALYSQAKAVSTEHSIAVFADRLSEILAEAKRVGAFVYVDMEDCSLTSITLRAFKSALMRPEFKNYERCGIVLQAYLRRTKQDLNELIDWTRARNTPIAVRLVKGAYWDTETILAKQHGWPIPVWQQKCSSDAAYEELSLILLQNFQLVMPAFASHNIRSLCHAIKAAELMGVPPTEFELQALYGMADPIKRVFSAKGYLVREYSPIGELIPGMGYLVRRLLENTSNEGFLRLSMHEQRNPEELLARPHFGVGDTGDEHLAKNLRVRFVNAALADMTIDDERIAIRGAIDQLRERSASGTTQVQPILNGKLFPREDYLLSTSPEDPNLVLAKIQLALPEDVERAIESLAKFADSWRRTPVSKRTQVLYRAAELLQRERAAMTAVIVLEAGKTWAEADADVAEAIDFLNYYALEAERLFTVRRMGSLSGESNRYFYEPRGVCAVISPWNFPLAIPCGMLVAALVTGNTAILKPAEQTSLTAFRFFKILLEAGLPPEAAAFIPGRGEEVGPIMMAHREVSTIVFTGSKEVGLLLNRQGAQFSDGAAHVKRVITEMGGKNAIIVDDDADYDEAVKAIVHSAFGYSGQKCSACSRALIVGDVYERVLSRIAEATKSLHVGPASDPRTFVGPVIDSESAERIRDVVRRAQQSCALVAEGPAPELHMPTFVRPAIFAGIPEGHELTTKEIFGPVLAVQQAKSFEHALAMANSSEYGLTGAVFSRSPRHIELACAEFRVGNLYINRGSTGALVMRQPFGGSKMSGVGSKAGGPDYLLQFVVPRSVTENTMRRGFAPREDV